LRCSAPRFEPGGGGINVSRAIKKLGGDSYFSNSCMLFYVKFCINTFHRL
jgi:hypothetical protein